MQREEPRKRLFFFGHVSRTPVAVAVILFLPLHLTFGSPSAATEPTDKTPQGRRAWVRREKAKHCFAPPDGQAPCGDCPGLDREAGEHAVFRRDIPVSSKNPGGGVDPECRRHGGRGGRGVFLWAMFLCTSKEELFQQPNGWSTRLAPRREAKALDSASALAWAPQGRPERRPEEPCPGDSREIQWANPKAKNESGVLEGRAFTPASQERVTSLCSCKEK